MSCGATEQHVRLGHFSTHSRVYEARGFVMCTVSTITAVSRGGGTCPHYLWFVQLKLFPFPHQLGSLVKEPSVCGYSAWLRSTENAGLFFYYNAEWASIKGALKTMFWIRKTPFIKVLLSLCVCLCTSVSIWQIEGKAVQQQCMTFHQWLCSLLCLTFKTGEFHYGEWKPLCKSNLWE